MVGGSVAAACSVGANGMAPPTNDASAESMDGSVDGPVDATDAGTLLDAVTEPTDASFEAEAETTDAASEASTTDAGRASACNALNCGGACCGDTCVPRTCAGCAVAPRFCPYSFSAAASNGVCVADCAECNPDDAGVLISCASCAGGAEVVRCSQSTSQCPTTLAAGACACSQGGADGGNCPVASQVCIVPTAGPGSCLTCGQPGTQGQSCADGKVCVEAEAKCAPAP